jgi:hypothetical protein
MDPGSVTPCRRCDSPELNEQGKRTDESPRSHALDAIRRVVDANINHDATHSSF